jgi:hypothetical protein
MGIAWRAQYTHTKVRGVAEETFVLLPWGVGEVSIT